LGYSWFLVLQQAGKGMAAIDPELERHRRTWIGFTRLIKYAIVIIIIILVGMAIFLV
jgi:hypothetical protein